MKIGSDLTKLSSQRVARFWDTVYILSVQLHMINSKGLSRFTSVVVRLLVIGQLTASSVAVSAGNWTRRMLADFESTAVLFALLLAVALVLPIS